MKYLVILFFLFILNFCSADFWKTNASLYNNPLYYNSHATFEPNPIILHPDRYINDLGHEFPIVFVVEGTYWKGGDWGSRNGFDNYYGNEYFIAPIYQISDNYATVPEPSTLFILISSTFLLRKKSNKCFYREK